MKKANLLIVDDDKYILLSLKMFLESKFENIYTTDDPTNIPDLIIKNSIDTVLLDMNYKPGDTSGDDGIFWLRKIKDHDPLISIIVITAYGEIQKAVRAIKAGAMDFIVKPWENEKLLPTVETAVHLSQSQRKVKHLKEQQEFISRTGSTDPYQIIGSSKETKQLMEQIKKVACTDANILISGENGTGKEIVAQNLHRESLRSSECLINVDLGSISSSLFESELFGHIKGSFTDAIADRMGRIEAASGGTLFLDEISNLPINLQSKLLKALQERKITRVGSHKEISIDFRLICATNMNLDLMIKEGRFREDLLYRINTVEIKLKSLRDRIEDIPDLIEHFLTIYNKKYRKSVKVPEYVVKKLMKYHWPGNIRELQHSIERAVIMSESNKLKSNDFSLGSESSELSDNNSSYHLESIEKQTILECIRSNNGNLTKAADQLGLTRGALYRRIEKYGI